MAEEIENASTPGSVLSVPNVRFFIAFRVFFNARFYYPIFTILFLDFGLTLEQFALLNAAWAATIICAEVPSGALADRFGRRQLVRFAGTLMVIEMVLLCLTPIGATPWLFWIFLINRILSGLAEAAASGADEALAFDSLSEVGRESEWPRVLEALMRFQSAAFFLAMALGAAVYDPNLVGKIASWFGSTREFTQADTLHWPLYLNLLTAFGAFWAAQKMSETLSKKEENASLSGPWRQTIRTGMWILRSPLPFLLILGGLFFDSIIRLFATLISEYYRMIDVPEAWYGVIGSAVALSGLFLAQVPRWMVDHLSLRANVSLLAVWVTVSLWGIAFFLPGWGVLFAVASMMSMRFADFFLSHYLNREVDPDHRATVLSFRGLAMNLGYGGLSLAYGWSIGALKENGATGDQAFSQALAFFSPWFLMTMVILYGVVRWRTKTRSGIA